MTEPKTSGEQFQGIVEQYNVRWEIDSWYTKTKLKNEAWKIPKTALRGTIKNFQWRWFQWWRKCWAALYFLNV